MIELKIEGSNIIYEFDDMYDLEEWLQVQLAEIETRKYLESEE